MTTFAPHYLQTCTEKQYAQGTKYSKLYSNVYWGNNRFNINDHEHYQSIFENRNTFKTQYYIKSACLRLNKKIRARAQILTNDGKFDWGSIYPDDIRDHIEYYKTEDGKILTIFSRDVIDDDLHNHILGHGYTLIDPLYDTSQKTYLKYLT